MSSPIIYVKNVNSALSKICRAYLLLDKENRDVGGDGDVTHGNMPEQGGLSDTVATNETITATMSKGKRGTGAELLS